MDKRNLGQKTMMQEIKDVAERRRSEDQTIYLSTTNFATRLTPDLIFDDRHEWALCLGLLQHTSHLGIAIYFAQDAELPKQTKAQFLD